MILIKNLTLRRGVKVVLQNASVTLNPNDKVGLVGRNGAGKSSLFSLIAGRLHADAGDVEMPPRWRIGEVAQSMPETDEPATDFVLDGDLPLAEANAVLAAAEASGDGHAIAEAHMHLEQAGVFDSRARAQALLLGARSLALLSGRFNVAIDDVRSLAAAALRHRILLNFEGQADGIRTDDVVQAALSATSA